MERKGLGSALTWRSLLILLFVVFLLAPMDTFLQVSFFSRFLSAGPGYMVGVPALWVTVILFTEIARVFGKPLTRHEVFLIYFLFGTAMTETFFIDILYQGYHKTHLLSTQFIDPRTGKLLSYVLPGWYAPPIGSPAYHLRSFLHADWLLPIAVLILAVGFGLCSELGLGLLCAHLYVEVEKLPYPTAPLGSESIITISEREPTRVKVFTIATVISLIWSAFSFGVPTTLGYAFGIRAGYLTFIDLTTVLDKYFPGVVYGVIFEPFAYTFAWMLPASTIISIFIGSYAIWVLGNWLTLQIPSPLFAQFQREYVIGSPASLVIWRANINVWLSFFIGAALGIAVVRLIAGRKYLVRSIRSLARLGKTAQVKTGYPPLPIILTLWLGGLLGSTVLVYILVPQFPLWTLVLFLVGIPFVAAMINARGVGETGFGVSIPNMKESAILSSGYKGAEAWFMPLYTRGFGMGSLASDYSYIAKVAQITETRFMDYVKTLLMLLPLTVVMSFIVISLFWTMAPVPSFTYPATVNLWPELVVEQNFIATNFFKLFKPELMVSAFAVLTVLTIVSSVVRIPFFSPIALVVGFNTAPYFANALAIGYLIGVHLFQKKLGKDWWNRYKAVILAGVACGYGIIATLTGVTTLISRALWYSPTPY